MHTSSQPRMLGGLDELAIQALILKTPVTRPSDGYLAFDLVWDDETPEDVAVTNQFVRFSAPYERVELDLSSPMTTLRARPTRFVTTVTTRAPLPSAPAPSATLSFDKMWFEQPDEEIAAIETAAGEGVAVARANSWLWLGISLLVATVAVGFMQYAL